MVGSNIDKNGSKIEGVWDRVSRRFVEQLRGEVHVLVSPDKVNGIFELSELEVLLNNTKVTKIEGIDREVLVELAQTKGLNDVKHALSAASFARVEMSGLLDGNTAKYLSTTADDVLEYVKDPANLSALQQKIAAFGNHATLDKGLQGVRHLRSFAALAEVGTIAAARGIPHLARLGAVGLVLDGIFLAVEASNAESGEESREIMETWAADAIGSQAGSLAAAALAGAATAALALSAPVAVPLLIGATIAGGFLGSAVADELYTALNAADERIRRDMVRRLNKLYFGDGTADIVSVLPQESSNFVFVDPKGSAYTILSAAHSSIAWRYALVELNPFVVPDAPYDTLHNQNGELDLYDAETGQGLTNDFLLARAESLVTYAQVLQDGDELGYIDDFPDGHAIHFLDAKIESVVSEHGVELDLRESSNGVPQRLFGDIGNDVLIGSTGVDKLFGGSGDDRLEGNGGGDYLEGGAGNDVYLLVGGESLFDSDRVGELRFGDAILSGRMYLQEGGFYADANGDHQYALAGGDLLVTRTTDNASVRIRTFNNGDFGIELFDTVDQPAGYRRPGLGTSASEYIYGSFEVGQASHEGFNHDDHLIGYEGRDWIFAWEKPVESVDDLDGSSVLFESVAPDRDIVEGGLGKDVIYGGAGEDKLYATSILDAEEVKKGQGSIAFAGPQGDWGDLINAGYGDDELYGSAMLDGLFGGDGDDLIYGGGGDDQIHGDMQPFLREGVIPLNANGWDLQWISIDPDDGSATTYFPYRYQFIGNDRIFAGDGNDTVFGEAGDDVIHGGQGNDALSGDIAQPENYTAGDRLPGSLHGDDILDGGQGDDVLIGNGGDDRLFGGDGADWLDGDFRQLFSDDVHYQGDDLLDGGDGDDVLIGNGQSDILIGAAGDDQLFGDVDGLDASFHGDDVLHGDEGDDVIVGHGANDTLYGGRGNDVLYGDDIDVFAVNGNDSLFGGDGDDQLSGGRGNDVLAGDNGRDRLWGDGGDDRLEGGKGVDYLAGGEGADTYVFMRGDSQVENALIDTIVDDGGQGNRIEFGPHVSQDAVSVLRHGAGSDLLLTYGEGDVIHVSGGLTGSIEAYAFGSAYFSHYRHLIEGLIDHASFLTGGVGDDLVFGSGDVDELEGGAGDDELLAGDADDQLDGGAGGDLLVGGKGDDLLYGGAGSDTYRFGSGHGHDIVTDNQGFDTLWFADARLADIAISQSGNDLVFARGEDSVRLRNWQSSSVEQLRFAGGNVVALDRVFESEPGMGKYFDASDIDDGKLLGSEGDDVFAPGDASVTIVGGAGDDVYRLSEGAGFVIVDDHAGNTTLVLQGKPDAEVYLNIQGDDLVVSVNGRSAARLTGGASMPPTRVIMPSGDSLTGEALSAQINTGPVATGSQSAVTVEQDGEFQWAIPHGIFSDPDGETLNIEVFAADGGALPAWLSFDPQTRMLGGMPGNADVGALDVLIVATDRGGLQVEQAFTIDVTDVNDAPQVIAPPGKIVVETGYGFSEPLAGVVFQDIDIGDALTYSLSSADGGPAPTWVQVDATTGRLHGIPSTGDVGQLGLLLTATDHSGAAVSVAATVEVVPDSNQALLHEAPLGAIDRFQVYDMVSAGDVDGDGFEDLLVQTAIDGSSASYAIRPDTLPEHSAAYVYYGQPGGWPNHPDRVTRLNDEVAFSRFSFGSYANAADGGFADVTIKPLGDVDGDGLADIGIETVNGGNWVFDILHGQTGGWEGDIEQLAPRDVTTIVMGSASAPRPSLHVGVLDWNGDGTNDLLFSDNTSKVGLHINMAQRKGQTVSAGDFQTNADTDLYNTVDPTGSGIIALSGVGDINGDGFEDLFVSSQHERQRTLGADQAYTQTYTAHVHRIVFGGALGQVSIDLAGLAPGAATEIVKGGAAINRLYSGLPVYGIGDINGDGFDDLAIGYANAPLSVVFGGQDLSQGIELDALNGSNGFVVEGLPYTYYTTDGFEVTGGDVNNDGIGDLLIGSFAGDDEQAGQNGIGWTIFGKQTAFDPIVDVWSLGANDGYRIVTPYPGLAAEWSGRDQINVHQPYEGIEQLAVADINGDGMADLLKSAVNVDVASIHTLYGKPGVKVGGDTDQSPDAEITVDRAGTVYTFGGDDLVTVKPVDGNTTVDTGSGNDIVIIQADQDDGVSDHTGETRVHAGDGDDLLRVEIPLNASGVQLPKYGTYLYGGAGSDTYEVTARGTQSGSIFINDPSLDGQRNDLAMGRGYTASGLSLGFGSLRLTFEDDGLEIHLENFDRYNVLESPRDIDTFTFADGSVLSYEEIVARGFDVVGSDGDDDLLGSSVADRLMGLGGDDVLEGLQGDDVLDGGTGRNTLVGGQGDDTYIINAAGGSNTIVDSGGTDTVRFGEGAQPNSSWVDKYLGDLHVGFGPGFSVRLPGWFEQPANRIERFEFADGTSMDPSELYKEWQLSADVVVFQSPRLVPGLIAEPAGSAGDDSAVQPIIAADQPESESQLARLVSDMATFQPTAPADASNLPVPDAGEMPLAASYWQPAA